MAKDINIHVKTPGAQQGKQQLDDLSGSAKNVGKQVEEGQKKLSGMGKIIGTLKNQVTGFIAGWLGLQGVMKLIDFLIEKLQRIKQLQEDIYTKTVSLSEIGQALEFQTGTRGQQQFWTQQAIALQRVGGLPSAQIAQQMMISADIAFAGQGGIKQPQIMNLLTGLAPFFGAAGIGPTEVAKVFEFGGTAGIEPTPQAYKQFLAQLQAGYTASKATSFGAFMEGLQKGGTAYMSMGGTLSQAISAFSATRAVTANEALAATLLEQIARLSGGAYEKPRLAIEKTLGVKWDRLGMDQRMSALLQYVGGIPESQRGRVLAEQGFPVELSTQIGKMVSPEAISTMAATSRLVGAAGPSAVDEMGIAYIQSMLGQQRQLEAQTAGGQVQAGPQFANWQRRIKRARAVHEILVATGKDSWALDKVEPYIMALQEMLTEVKSLPQSPETELLQLEIVQSLHNMGSGFSLTAPFYPKGLAERAGYGYERRLGKLSSQPIIVNDNSTNFYPRTGSDERGPRTDRDIR